ncbi:MAG: GNAT family protein [Candidatus Nealsonbacteria bacterium]|nr:GNAT family protein [Candidatus Nealsonbacteria bacterium]
MLKGKVNEKDILLRPVRKSDLECLLKWMNDTEVNQYLLNRFPMTEITEGKWIEELSTTRRNTDIVFMIEVKQKPIGICGLHMINLIDQNAGVGMAIGEKKYWSKGYGTESLRLLVNYAFRNLNLNSLSAGAMDFNERSIKMQKKIGFQREGRRRQHFFKNGKFHDEILFGLLREEWKKKQKFKDTN